MTRVDPVAWARVYPLDGDGCYCAGLENGAPQPTQPLRVPQPVAQPPKPQSRIHMGLWILCAVAALWWLWFLAYIFGYIK